MTDEREDPADPIRSARDRGREARAQGEPASANPHGASARLAEAWEQGWREGGSKRAD